MNKKTFIALILGLILLRAALIILLLNNVPFTDMQPNWRPHFNESYRPDEQQFFDIAEGLASGKIINYSVVNFGAPLFFTPIVYLSGAKTPAEIAKPVFIIQEFILFPLALIIVALIAQYLFGRYLWAVASAGLFAVYPWLFLGFGKLINYSGAIPAFHYQLWIMVHSDYISAFLVYLSFYFLFKWFAEFFKDSDIKFKHLVFLALSSGLALLTRMTNIWLVLIIFTAFLYFRKFKKILFYGLYLAIVYSPQLIFNILAFGVPWTYGYTSEGPGGYGPRAPAQWFRISNLWLNFNHFSPSHYFFVFSMIAVFFAMIYIFGFRYLKIKNRQFAWITAGWFWSYFLFYGMFSYSLQSLRYFLPAVPVFIYFFVGSVIYLYRKLSSKRTLNDV